MFQMGQSCGKERTDVYLLPLSEPRKSLLSAICIASTRMNSPRPAQLLHPDRRLLDDLGYHVPFSNSGGLTCKLGLSTLRQHEDSRPMPPKCSLSRSFP
jgi:hypothetical protein